MKLRTHFIIAKIAAEHTGFTFLEKTAFCIGSLILIYHLCSLYTVTFMQNPANMYKKSWNEFQDEILYLRCLYTEKMAHYVSDFLLLCTFRRSYREYS